MSLYDGNTEAAKFCPMLKWKIIPTSKWNTPMELFHLTIDDAKWDLNLFTYNVESNNNFSVDKVNFPENIDN